MVIQVEPLLKSDKEEWRDVIGYEGLYQVSNLGRLRSLRRGTVSKVTPNKAGYILVTLRDSKGNPSTKKLHRLVAEAFIPNPQNKPCVNHEDGIKHNNHVDNLIWCTYSENTQHAYDNSLIPKVLNNSQILEICRLLDDGNETSADISGLYGVSKATITNIHLGTTWSTLTGRKGKIKPQSGLKGRKNPKSKPVVNCRGCTYESSPIAALDCGTYASHISRCCRGLRNSAGKYEDGTPIKWKYLNKD